MTHRLGRWRTFSLIDGNLIAEGCIKHPQLLDSPQTLVAVVCP
jgi:hypothetical protein